MPRSSYAVSRPVAPRKWLALVALLSFFLQSLAVQTHIHQQFPLAGGNAVTQGVPIPRRSKPRIRWISAGFARSWSMPVTLLNLLLLRPSPA
jgi:hypothetical protein